MIKPIREGARDNANKAGNFPQLTAKAGINHPNAVSAPADSAPSLLFVNEYTKKAIDNGEIASVICPMSDMLWLVGKLEVVDSHAARL